jgi:hypothetical protein
MQLDGRHRTYSILAHMDDHVGYRPVMAVLVIPESHCDVLLQNGTLGMKTLKRMGFVNISCVELSKLGGGYTASSPVLFYFERQPQPSEVFIADIGHGGRISHRETKVQKGEPHEIMPQVTGLLAKKHIYRNSGPGIADFHRPEAALAQPRKKLPVR